MSEVADSVPNADPPSHVLLSVPYEKQITDNANQKMCGAATLCMVYQSFGKDWSQTDIWPDVNSRDRQGKFHVRTQHMAHDAIKRGFAAIIVKARDPWQLLQQCNRERIIAIVNHRLQRSTSAGHFSVLVGFEETAVIIHDPFVGPERRLTKNEFLVLWDSTYGRTEIGGNVLVAFAESIPEEPAFQCRTCSQTIPRDYICPRCQAKVNLWPAGALGCTVTACTGRTWNRIYCPQCDEAIREIPTPPPPPLPSKEQSTAETATPPE